MGEGGSIPKFLEDLLPARAHMSRFGHVLAAAELAGKARKRADEEREHAKREREATPPPRQELEQEPERRPPMPGDDAWNYETGSYESGCEPVREEIL